MHLEVKYLETEQYGSSWAWKDEWSLEKPTHHPDSCKNPQVWSHGSHTHKRMVMPFTFQLVLSPLLRRGRAANKLTLRIPNSSPMSPFSVLLQVLQQLLQFFYAVVDTPNKSFAVKVPENYCCLDCRHAGELSVPGFSALISWAGEANFPICDSKCLTHNFRCIRRNAKNT